MGIADEYCGCRDDDGRPDRTNCADHGSTLPPRLAHLAPIIVAPAAMRPMREPGDETPDPIPTDEQRARMALDWLVVPFDHNDWNNTSLVVALLLTQATEHERKNNRERAHGLKQMAAQLGITRHKVQARVAADALDGGSR